MLKFFRKYKSYLFGLTLMVLLICSAFLIFLNEIFAISIASHFFFLAKLCISLGADVNQRTYLGLGKCYPIVTVHVLAGDSEAVDFLLTHGADANAADLDIPLIFLVPKSSNEYPDKKSNEKISNLYIIESIIKNGVDINARFPSTQRTRLIESIRDGDLIVAEKLLSCGADPDLEDKFGKTALMYAIQKGDTQAVTLLIRNKASIEYKSSLGKNAIQIAKEHNQKEIELLLLERSREKNNR